jgi:trehalose synthase
MPEKLREIHADPRPLVPFEALLGKEQLARVDRAWRELAKRLDGRSLFTISSEEWGSSIPESRRSLVEYARGAGVDAHWRVIEGPAEFFAISQELRAAIEGSGDLSRDIISGARELYDRTQRENAVELLARARSGDIVVLHDAETAGMIPHLSGAGLHVIWCCHEVTDSPSEASNLAWEFLAPALADGLAYIFPREGPIAPGIDGQRVFIIPSTLDPFSVKNRELDGENRRAILVHTGFLEPPAGSGAPVFARADGSPGRVDRRAEIETLGRAPRWDAKLVLQIARWDRSKDAAGVLQSFERVVAEAVEPAVQLVLAGPDVRAHSENPLAAEVFEEVRGVWRGLPHSVRQRVHIATLPMKDADENAAIVNALQQQATVVVQKNLRDGSGLAVAEAMWKRKPVLATAVGGIRDRIDDGVHGVLIKDATDSEAFAEALGGLLGNPEGAAEMGRRARERVGERFLDTTTLELFAALVQRLGIA